MYVALWSVLVVAIFWTLLLYPLRVNGTKVTLRNGIAANVFALESDKKSKNDKWSFLQDFPQIFDFSVYS